MAEWLQRFSELEREKIVPIAKKSLRSEEGKIALEYLKEKRRFSDEVIDKFNIGYCPANINHQLKGRLITPIYSTYGELAALSTRMMDKNVSNRFWHESFDKRTYLYALNFAKDSITKFNKCILMEGEFDVCAFHSWGLPIAVGVCGSSFTLFQTSMLLKCCSEIYLMFDGDEAGKAATQRALKIYKEYNLKHFGINFIPVKLPEKTDPDEYLFDIGKRGIIDKLKQSKEEFLDTEFKF